MVICLSAKGQVEKYFLSGMSDSCYAWNGFLLFWGGNLIGPNFFERNVLNPPCEWTCVEPAVAQYSSVLQESTKIPTFINRISDYPDKLTVIKLLLVDCL